jgi:hypothetical protein
MTITLWLTNSDRSVILQTSLITKEVDMKLSVIALALVAVMGTAQAQTQPHPYAMNQAPVVAPPAAPAWFVRLPEDTPDMIFSAAVGVSVDEQMAYDKARVQAERKLVEMMSARVRSNVKSYRNDRGDSMQESTEIVVNKTADGELIGAQRVDSQATFDGRTYRVDVLLRYPLAQNNSLRKEREGAQSKREADLRAARAQQDLERETQRQRTEAEAADRRLKEEIGPRPDAPAPAATVNTTEGPVKLMDVDNAEYKKKRDEALAKPGAVIGQTVVR